MGRLRWMLALGLLGGLMMMLLDVSSAQGPAQILQYGFEARGPVWKPRNEDAPYKVLAHHLTDETAHGGQRCEHLQIRAEKGSYIHYAFPVGRAPITEDLSVGLWLKANRPGVQLLCRVVLPRERDPYNVNQPLTALLRCEPYQSTRWKLLTLTQPVKRLQEQQQLLRLQLRRDINTADAYVSELVLNVYDGPGVVDVWIDDLEVGPVYDAPSPGVVGEPGSQTQAPGAPGSQGGAQPPRTNVPGSPAAHHRADTVELKGSNLYVNGQKFFIRGIRHTGTPLKTLRDAGFNTVWLDETSPDALVEDAVGLGFWLVPTITPPHLDERGRPEGTLVSGDVFARKVARFMKQEAILSWDLGSNLDSERFGDVARAARAFRAADPMRPVSADVWDGFQSYSRSLDQVMLGVHRWPLLTSLELTAYRDWLMARRRLVAPGTFCWTWVQNHLPDWFLQAGHGGGDSKEAMGPQPEQVRLLAYIAIGCGYRGLAFWSDRFLADSHAGRDRLLGLALLNQELQMLEPILVEADASREPEWVQTDRNEVNASVIRTSKGVLVLPVWMGDGAQYVPGQSSVPTLKVTVPLVPATATCWEISPGYIRALKTERVLGGVRVGLHSFSLTSALLFTSDLSPTGLVVRLQDQQRRMARQAAQWSHSLAQEELTKVEKVQAELEKIGHAVSDSSAVLQKAREAVQRCVEHRRNGEHGEAYADAQVALRALRVLMRAQWDQAVRNLQTPVASPYAVSYFTLPRHWQFLDELHQLRAGENVLPGGDFETPPDKTPPGWLVQEVPTPDLVQPTAKRVTTIPRQGKQCVMLSLVSKSPVIQLALERGFVAVHSPAVKLPPGTPVRISVWVRSQWIGSSADGALVYDSAGGEPLAVRFGLTKGWRRYDLYRKVPASGKISVTLAMSALGEAFFDDVRIEPLVPAGQGAPQRTASAAADRTGVRGQESGVRSQGSGISQNSTSRPAP